MMETAHPFARRTFGAPGPERPLPVEAAVALSFNGTTQAVMMATPADLEDFATGFALTEGIATPQEIREIEVAELPQGIDLRVWLTDEAAARLIRRRRSMAGPVGCGLCGLDSLEEAVREPPALPPSPLRLTPAQVMAAVAALPAHQPLHDETRAVHAAAFWTPEGILAAREDVGRHNALDKLAGALIRSSTPATTGAVVMTSRVSVDLVQKCVRIGAPVLIAVSAPTSAALELANRAGLTVAALARPDRFQLFTHPGRIADDG